MERLKKRNLFLLVLSLSGGLALGMENRQNWRQSAGDESQFSNNPTMRGWSTPDKKTRNVYNPNQPQESTNWARGTQGSYNYDQPYQSLDGNTDYSQQYTNRGGMQDPYGTSRRFETQGARMY